MQEWVDGELTTKTPRPNRPHRMILLAQVSMLFQSVTDKLTLLEAVES